MSVARETADRFNRISEVYDETRQPLTREAIDRATEILRADGVRRILEAGVGTGRIALPLQQRKFKIYGVDVAKKMLMKANEKGVQNLIIADANHLPIRDKQVDAAILAHVIHLLENPELTFQSLGRVAVKEIVAFVRKRDDVPAMDDGRASLRENFRRVAAELGYELPDRPGGWWAGFRKEREFLSRSPPTELLTIEDREIVTTMRERISFFEKRAYGHPTELPEQQFRRIMKRVAKSMDLDREIRYRRAEQMAIWRLPRQSRTAASRGDARQRTATSLTIESRRSSRLS